MADSYHIIDGQVVPYYGGRKGTDTDAWRDATPLELRLQKELNEAATELEALRKRCEAVEAALRDLLALPFAIHQLQGLHQGIGTATRDAAWLNAEKAIAAAQEPSHG